MCCIAMLLEICSGVLAIQLVISACSSGDPLALSASTVATEPIITDPAKTAVIKVAASCFLLNFIKLSSLIVSNLLIQK